MNEGVWMKKIKWMKNIDEKITDLNKSEKSPITISIRY
jgi:hypothetical protein